MKVLKFYVLIFVYSWVIWLLGIFLFKESINTIGLVSIGGLGPIVGFIVYFCCLYDENERRDYLHRLWMFRTIPKYIWFFTILLPFTLVFLSSLFCNLFTSTTYPLMQIDKAFIQAGWFYPIFLFFFGPLPEEMAWRGIAYDKLLEKGYLKAQLIVAFFWALWHFPLFFIHDSYQASLGLFTLDFWMFMIEIIFISFITGWIYIRSRKSILLVVIFHYLINLTGEMFEITQQGKIVKMILYCIMGLVLIIVPFNAKTINIIKDRRQKNG